jgi:hypothetical protein
MLVTNLVTPKAAAKRELMFNKPTSVASIRKSNEVQKEKFLSLGWDFYTRSLNLSVTSQTVKNIILLQ